MKKSYSIRVFPSKEQIDELNELSSIRKDIWNKLLDTEENEYKINKKILNKFDLNNLLPELKEKYPEWKKLNSKAVQTIATELFGSYRSFFNLIKKDKSARPPRKIENNDYHTIVWNQSGWIIQENDTIIINKIPFNYKSKIDITDLNIKEIKIKYVRNKWLCDIIVEEPIKYKDKLNKALKNFKEYSKSPEFITDTKEREERRNFFKNIFNCHTKASCPELSENSSVLGTWTLCLGSRNIGYNQSSD